MGSMRTAPILTRTADAMVGFTKVKKHQVSTKRGWGGQPLATDRIKNESGHKLAALSHSDATAQKMPGQAR